MSESEYGRTVEQGSRRDPTWSSDSVAKGVELAQASFEPCRGPRRTPCDVFRATARQIVSLTTASTPTIVGLAPSVTDENKTFWAEAAEGRLVVERCSVCDAFLFPPRGMCRHCLSRDVAPVEITGPGTVHSYTVNFVAWLPGMDVPSIYALIEFDEAPGIRIPARVEAEHFEDVEIGTAVVVGFADGPGGYRVPSFRTVPR